MNALKDPDQSVIVNLLAVPLSRRPDFLARLHSMVEQMRAEFERPHWLFLDEAHHMLPPDREPAWSRLSPKDCVMVTVEPASIAPSVVSSVDILLATDADSLRKFAELTGKPAISFNEAPAKGGDCRMETHGRLRSHAAKTATERNATIAASAQIRGRRASGRSELLFSWI
jgi:hypothetical protein